MKAYWNDKLIAEGDDVVELEGNVYFAKSAIKEKFFVESNTKSQCPWKGTASYYTIEVEGKTNPDAAWYYPNPKDAALNIKDRIAFWKGVEVKE
jgi:uncharacterized protein (DUF427 family)